MVVALFWVILPSTGSTFNRAEEMLSDVGGGKKNTPDQSGLIHSRIPF